MEVKSHLKDCLSLFVQDPPDSDFQRGYLACLYELSRVFKVEIDAPTSVLIEDMIKDKK